MCSHGPPLAPASSTAAAPSASAPRLRRHDLIRGGAGAPGLGAGVAAATAAGAAASAAAPAAAGALGQVLHVVALLVRVSQGVVVPRSAQDAVLDASLQRQLHLLAGLLLGDLLMPGQVLGQLGGRRSPSGVVQGPQGVQDGVLVYWCALCHLGFGSGREYDCPGGEVGVD